MDRLKKIGTVVIFCAGAALAAGRPVKPPAIKIRQDDQAGELRVLIGGREAVTYRYAANLDLPHYWPMRSPSGKNMLVEQTEPYPHHRSFWFGDTVRLEGEARDISTYNALYSGVKDDAGVYGAPFGDRVRHTGFSKVAAKGPRAEIDAELVWEMDGTCPVLRERRRLVVHSLGDGEYLLDITWTLEAEYGDVLFKSDDVHYAWPYLRLDPRFSGEKGGAITSDTGAVGEKATNLKFARWMDYTNTVDGTTEGVAIFQWPDGRDHRWLTREYGTFGPRRPDDQSGKPFTLRKGESITQRVGVLAHKGNVSSGHVRERYERFIRGGWK
jgi:hypothetical protein